MELQVPVAVQISRTSGNLYTVFSSSYTILNIPTMSTQGSNVSIFWPIFVSLSLENNYWSAFPFAMLLVVALKNSRTSKLALLGVEGGWKAVSFVG